MSGEAPPKLVAMAMEKLGQASRLIADIRLGADRFLEVLFVSAQPHLSNKPLHLFLKEDESVRHHLQDLRNIGRELAELGVLNESLRARSNYWGLHMPLVCPDGAVVAYAWKRQLAAQAGASAVDRTRLALKAFTDQKRRVFPHLDEDLNCQIVGTEAVEKKHNVSQLSTTSQQEEPNDFRLQDVLISLQKEIPVIEVSTYQRLDWLKRATSLSAHETSVDLLKEHSFHDPNNHKPQSLGVSAASRMSIIEMLCPSVFRAIVSLHPAGSVEPSSVAFYSPYERGNYIHARGSSIYQVYRHISEHAAMALQYFLGNRREMALSSLLHWICSYQFLFTKACSKCGRLLSMEKNSALLLPPVCRPYRQPSKDRIPDLFSHAFHVNCFAEQVYLYLD